MNAPSVEPGTLVAARGREWVVLPGSTSEALRLRPIVGTEAERTVILPALEREPVGAARFPDPSPERLGNSAKARLLVDALRLSFRQGAGPFRSAGRIGFAPRGYQLVPLIMALGLDPVRLLIADDVGIGKTVEAGLILRELMDRGEVVHACVLCPPHLIEQWVEELEAKFSLRAVAVTASSAARLERGLEPGQSLFEAYPLTVVSLDYIKAERRRADFRRHCPPFVIVDEAHACVGGGTRGANRRHELVRDLAADASRHLVLLTATPHSGKSDAFDRLVGLLDERFADGAALEGEARRADLARHFVQRRRIDVRDEGWEDDERIFPTHEVGQLSYALDGAHLELHDAVLEYCLGVAEAVGADERRRRESFWGTLALMRCVGSSPAAALSALSNRRASRADRDGDDPTEAADEIGESLEAAVFDEEDGRAAEDDLEPSGEGPIWRDDAALAALVERARALVEAPEDDPKARELVKALKKMIRTAGGGSRPVVFCRFVATAEAVGERLREAFPRHRVEVVTGRMSASERKRAVHAMVEDEKRMLVATDCLSEGINLQGLFDAVVHYDLAWNPTRHLQREGRVDRFGQPSETVRSLTLFATNSAIDGAVLDVILRKGRAIRDATGISIGAVQDHDAITAALMQRVLLHEGRGRQIALDLGLDERAEEEIELAWRDAEENEKRSRARFAQNRLRPEAVVPEWERAREHLGGPDAVRRFVTASMAHLDAPVEERGGGRGEGADGGPGGGPVRLPLGALPSALRESLATERLEGTVRAGFGAGVPEGVLSLHRAHPLVAALSGHLAESALEGGEGRLVLPRCGAWPVAGTIDGSDAMVTVALLRARHRLHRPRDERRDGAADADDFLLVEELVALAFRGTEPEPAAEGSAALAHLDRAASANLDEAVRRRQVTRALERLAEREGALETAVRRRAEALAEDHDRLRAAARGGRRTEVRPVLPADLIGVWVLLPEGDD